MVEIRQKSTYREEQGEGGQSALSAPTGIWACPRRLGSSSKEVNTQAT